MGMKGRAEKEKYFKHKEQQAQRLGDLGKCSLMKYILSQLTVTDG